MTKFILRWVINAIALYLAVLILPGIDLRSDLVSILWLALIFGLVNALFRPLIQLLTCPLIILTLGLFTLVINTFLFWLTSVIGQSFGFGLTISDPIWWNAFLGGLDDELPYYEIASLKHFRTVEAEYPANWKLIVDAFLEAYHIRVLHKDTIYPFFADGITAGERFGPHISSLVARRAAQDWATQSAHSDEDVPLEALRQLVTPSQVIFPNTITIFHPDYLSLITLYPSGPETLRWTHRMLIPPDKATPDWAPHWEKTFKLIDQGVFQKEDIRCAIGIQQGLKTGANTHITVGRMEQGDPS